MVKQRAHGLGWTACGLRAIFAEPLSLSIGRLVFVMVGEGNRQAVGMYVPFGWVDLSVAAGCELAGTALKNSRMSLLGAIIA